MQFTENSRFRNTLHYIWHSPTFTTWGNFGVSSLRLLVLLPYILNRLSTEENAVWMLFMGLLAIGNLADLGFSPTFTRMVAYVMGGLQNFNYDLTTPPNSQNSTEKPPVNWALMEKLYGTIGSVNLILCFVAAILLAIFGTFSLWKPVHNLDNQEVYWQAWAVLCISIAIIFNGKKYEAVLNGLGFVALVNRWNIVFGLLSVFASLVVVILQGNILYLMLASQFFAVITLFRNRYLLLHEVCEKRFAQFKTLNFEPTIFKIAFSAAWRQGISNFFAVGIAEATNVMYAQVSDASRLVAYQLAFRLITQLAEFSKAPFYSKLPEFSRLRAANEIDTLTFRVEKSMQLSLLFFVSGGLAIAFFASWGLQLIHAKVTFVAVELWLLMLLVYFMERMTSMHAQQYITTNKIPYHKTIVITGLVNLGFIYIFINKFDVWVFPLAQGFASLLIHLWWLPKISMQTMSRPPLQFLWNSLALPIGIFLLGVLGLYVKSIF
jgi:O-antigen/teichoic acid export membrane protein